MLAPSRTDLKRAGLYMMGAALLFAAMGAGVKTASRELPNTMVVFFRNAVGFLTLLPWLARGGLVNLRTRHFKEHAVRGLAGLLAMSCFFYAIARLRLADAMLLYQSVPLFLPFVEGFWLKEAVPSRVWWPIGMGFLGLLCILKPGTGLFEPAALVGVSSALFAAVAQVGIRRLTRTEPATRIVFYFAVIATAVSSLPLAFSWVTPSPRLWAVLLVMGTLATFGQLCLTQAYAYAPAARVGPFIYTGVVFASLIDWLLWGTLPDRYSVLGAFVVVGAALLALRMRDAADPATVPIGPN
ncbi:MAG TPA: DMT family transporter [Vicinamibacteria bacterium]|nr:DMT family transporter [Vicinamibacteria bacterium]